MPSWPGRYSAWATARGERTVMVGPGAVAGSSVPSQKATVKGRSGSASASAPRRGPVFARAKAQVVSASSFFC